MAELKPFRGIRYRDASDLGRLTCPPYDVISPEQQRRLHQLHPHNAVRLELAQTGGNPQGYRDVGITFRRWLQEGVLAPDPDERYYVYRQDFIAPDGTSRTVTGVIGALTLQPWGRDVLPHERTMPGPKADRLALLRACPVNLSPLYAIYRGSGAGRAALERVTAAPPDGDLTDPDGVRHRVWAVPGEALAEVGAAVASLPVVIADGHHRYETALAYHEERGGSGPHSAVMTLCVDADSEPLLVLPYHRYGRVGIDPAELRRRLLDAGARPGDPPTADGHRYTFVLPSDELHLVLSDEDVDGALEGPPAWRRLDVVVLHELVLPRVLPEGFAELGFSRDAEAVRALVAAGDADVAILVDPVAPAEVVDVAASGARLPQKASYFWPKAITGLVFRPLD